MLQISPTQAKTFLQITMDAKKVPYLASAPGVGKSAIYAQIAADRNLFVIDIRMAGAEPTDLNGFGVPNQATGKAEYMPFVTFPIEGDQIPEGYDGWMVLLDELPSAHQSVLKACYKLILDRMVGQHHLHDKVFVVAAGNRMQDGAMVNKMGTALQSRMVSFELKFNLQDYLDHATAAGFDSRVIAFNNAFPDKVHVFKANHGDCTFPSPRTYEFLSDMIKPIDDLDGLLPLMAGTIGEGMAMEFEAFIDLFGKIPSLAEVLASPKTVTVPECPSRLYAMISIVSAGFEDECNFDAVFTYFNRMPKEFETTAIKQGVRASKKLASSKLFRTWLTANSHLN